MADFRNGDHEAAAQLVELFYRELKRIEAARMRSERLDHTLQPTAVVHELYLELVKVKALRPANLDGVDEKAAFLGLAAFLMKRLLIHHARPFSRRAQKTELPDLPGASPAEHSLVEIDDVLDRLAAINPALRQVVELRGFEGLTREEVAQKMGWGPRYGGPPLELRPTLAGGSSRQEAVRVTQERWQLMYEIYEAAASLAEPERQPYVQATSPDAEIAAKVLEMLDEMETSAASDDFPSPTEHSNNLPNGAELGRFVITGFVGEGGMGRVYSAHDSELHREVAVKVIAREADSSSTERFIHEAQAASALNHPNIVTIYDVIHSGPTVAIAMELVTGT